MKTKQQIDEARKILRRRYMLEGPQLSSEQQCLLLGMLNAMVWCADGESCTTIERVLVGEPFSSPQEAKL